MVLIRTQIRSEEISIGHAVHLLSQLLRLLCLFPYVVYYRSVIHLCYPVDVSGDKTSAGGKEFVASCFPLRSGKADGLRDPMHIIAVKVAFSAKLRDVHHRSIVVPAGRRGRITVEEKRKSVMSTGFYDRKRAGGIG